MAKYGEEISMEPSKLLKIQPTTAIQEKPKIRLDADKHEQSAFIQDLFKDTFSQGVLNGNMANLGKNLPSNASGNTFVTDNELFGNSVQGLGGGGETAPTPWYQNGNTMQGYAGLASSFMQAIALPGQMKLAKLQRQGLEQNLAQARADSAINATARSNLNAPSWNAPPVTGMA